MLKVLSLATVVPAVLATAAPAAAQNPTTLPADLSTPTLQYVMRIHAPLHAPEFVTPGLAVFHPREGGRIEGPKVAGAMASPTGDWVRVTPNGDMRIDVRALIRLDDGSTAYLTYGGVLQKPAEKSWNRFLAGDEIRSPEFHYIITPNFETASTKYGWLNSVQGVGRLVSIQTGKNAHVTFDVFEVR